MKLNGDPDKNPGIIKHNGTVINAWWSLESFIVAETVRQVLKVLLIQQQPFFFTKIKMKNKWIS